MEQASIKRQLRQQAKAKADKQKAEADMQKSGTDVAEDVDWRAKSIEKFGLLPLPDEWATEELTAISQADNATWKRYYRRRRKRASQKEQRTSHLDPEECYGYDDYDDLSDSNLIKEIQAALVEEAKKIGGDGAAMWLKHASVSFGQSSWEDLDDIRSGTYFGCMYSPYALPRALRLRNVYHLRAGYYSCEFFTHWKFCLERFDGQPGGDAKQVSLSKQLPTGYSFNGLPAGARFVEDGFEDLCDVQYEEPPMINSTIDSECWVGIENSSVDGLTPSTVRRIRCWLFGHAVHSMGVLDDFSLMRLVFATVGTAGFKTPRGNTGYTWSTYNREAELKQSGVHIDPDAVIKITWIEHQVRTICGALRPIDGFYEPQDLVAKWTRWGTDVLDCYASSRAMDDPDRETQKEYNELSKAPILVYLRAKQKDLSFCDSFGGGLAGYFGGLLSAW